MSENVSGERKAWLRRQKRERRVVICSRVGVLLGFFGLWELAANLGWIDTFIMSSPSRAWKAAMQMGTELMPHIAMSCAETVAGFLLGTVLGTAIAAALWWSPRLARICEPYLVVLGALPKTALGPIFIVWMGAGVGAILTMALAIALIVTIMEVYAGFAAVEPEKLRLMRSLGASRAQTFGMLVLPSNLPTMMNALKVNVGLSWVGVIMGEFLVSKQGLGYLIVYGSQVFKMDLVMATVLILAAVASAMYAGMLALENVIKKHLGVTV
ncbi:MAG: ABC transporter permease [Ruminococcaceae bacterium]|nr:ABC transporter permease [Oscillospiraceae bacterium]